MSRRPRALLVLTGLVVALAAAAPAASAKTLPGSPPFRVLIMNHITPAQFRHLATRGAAGLLVPSVGPTTNRRRALAELVRGAEVNARLGGVPAGRPLLSANLATGMPSAARIIVVALPPRGDRLMSNDRRYPIVVIGGGFHGGQILTSPTTRIPGLVSIVDIAPTALGREPGSLRSVWVPDAMQTLARLDTQIHSNNRLKLPVLIVLACFVTLLAFLRPRAALTAVPAALLTSLALGAAQVTSEVAIMTWLVTGTVAGGVALARVCRNDDRLLALILAVLLAHLWLLVAHPAWVAVTPLGPTQNSRFWGFGNQLETLLLAPLLAGAAIAARRFGPVGFVLFALFGLVLMTDNRLGADGGGAIVLGVGFAFIGARSLRLGVRGFGILLGLAATLVLAVVSYNLRAPGPNHLRSAFGHGLPGLLAVAENRVPLAYAPVVQNWPLTLPLGIWFAATLLVALWRQRRPGARDLVLALGVAIVTSLLVNDSATYELTGGVVAAAAVARFAPTAVRVRLRLPVRASVPAAQPVARETD